jgi:hypothetical protein
VAFVLGILDGLEAAVAYYRSLNLRIERVMTVKPFVGVFGGIARSIFYMLEYSWIFATIGGAWSTT